MYCEKLGMTNADDRSVMLARALPDILASCRLDMTIFYRGLSSTRRSASGWAGGCARAASLDPRAL
jgi:uncharacterized protein YdiU (UPF0061 family)